MQTNMKQGPEVINGPHDGHFRSQETFFYLRGV